jgi:hypothetical protein
MNKNLIWIVVGIAVLYFLSTLKKGIVAPGSATGDAGMDGYGYSPDRPR